MRFRTNTGTALPWLGLAGALLLGLWPAAPAPTSSHTFGLGDSTFLLDGKPFVLVSGEMHFARIPREYWRDRLRMARAMGLNTIATYVFWNFQEPEKGAYHFSGNADVAGFVRAARAESLYVIIRPSAYACAEWEFGGYPWWLLREQGMKVRSRDPRYLELVRRYFSALGKELAPLQITQGGNIIMVQLENEYGSYGNDKEYLDLNRQIIRDAGFDVPLYTCDGGSQMPDGYLPGLLPAVNGLDNIVEVKALINKHHAGHGPYFIAEWYPAWFDSWGLPHHVVPAEQYVGKLDQVLANHVSINMYMAHGGTTFGFMNGANMDRVSPYAPQVTSYDYDAPINEAGNATPKFMAFREVIQKYLPPGTTLPPVPPAKIAAALAPIPLPETASLFENLPRPVAASHPLSFEDLNQGYGYLLYRSTVRGGRSGRLSIEHLRDYGLVFLNGRRTALLDRRRGEESAEIILPPGQVRLDILVENLGRINYGPFLNDNRKGITGRVIFAGEEITGWQMYGFPCNDLTGWRYRPAGKTDGPLVRRGTFRLETTADTYLDMRDWGKGIVILNGHHLGRYWNVGPQQTLYIPAPWLRKGDNEVAVLELFDGAQPTLRTLDHPVLDDLGNPVVTFAGSYDAQRRADVVTLASSGRESIIRYTLDGSDPGAGSPEYSSPLVIGQRTTVAARAFRRGRPSDQVARLEVHPSLTTCCPLKLAYPFSPRHPGGGAQTLVDGLMGGADYDDGFWQGFDGTDLVAVIDLGAPRAIRRLSTRFLQDTRSWVFYPTRVEYALSDDGVSFRPAGTVDHQPASADEKRSVYAFTVEHTGLPGRYLKVVAKSLGVCPPWHPGKGSNAWMFADEIVAE